MIPLRRGLIPTNAAQRQLLKQPRRLAVQMPPRQRPSIIPARNPPERKPFFDLKGAIDKKANIPDALNAILKFDEAVDLCFQEKAKAPTFTKPICFK